VNKPDRVLPRGLLSVREARCFALALYAVAIGLAVPVGRACTAIVVLTAALTWAYSAPPLRLKRFLFVANLTIAVPRGVLLKVAGWSAVGSVAGWEPWFIGLVFGVFVFGSVSTKDFADVEGDQRYGCVTLPIRFGNRAAAWIIAPFLVAPSILMVVGLGFGWLTGDRRVLLTLAAALVPWAAYVAHLMLREDAKARFGENQPSWTHMYLMSFVMQVGFAVAYIV
jgi:4-hydroxybenzoate polyprenyltransferase